MSDTIFSSFVKMADRAEEKSFWGYVRTQCASDSPPMINDLASVTSDVVHQLAESTNFTAADIEAGYRTLCAKMGTKPGWPSRVYP